MWPFKKRNAPIKPESDIIERFLKGLREHLSEEDKLELSYAFGADSKQLAELKHRYPKCPNTLVQLLRSINGTYWQQYGSHKIHVLILGSDVFKYPYYLKSVEQMLEGGGFDRSIREIYGKYFSDFPGLVGVGIDPDVKIDRWLCFSDCMNNGGTSQLYLDFNPSSEGVPGQVVRFLHDPDSFKVIANSFDEYLQILIDQGYGFIHLEE
jgi:SMI1 / KNR4 family (SUKH-1)